MKTITKEVYTFEEMLSREKDGKVSSRVVESVRDLLRERVTEHKWYDYIYDIWVAALDQIGFENAEINFSGFGSQGDGASFTATLDLKKLLAFFNADIKPNSAILTSSHFHGGEDFRPWLFHKIGWKPNPGWRWVSKVTDYLDGRVVRTRYRNYVHEHTCDVKIDFYDGRKERKRLEPLVNELEETAEELRVALCRAIYQDLTEEYEYRIADEQLVEDCNANKWHFDLWGRPE
jgi:hypothetical protein